MYYLAFGFVDATIGVGTLNYSDCTLYLTTYYTNYTVELPTHVKNKEWEKYVEATTDMLRNVDPLVNSCLWTADEMNDNYGRYTYTLTNPG